VLSIWDYYLGDIEAEGGTHCRGIGSRTDICAVYCGLLWRFGGLPGRGGSEFGTGDSIFKVGVSQLGVVVCACNPSFSARPPSTQEAKAGGWRVQGQPG
jgi:hypothetical protein